MRVHYAERLVFVAIVAAGVIALSACSKSAATVNNIAPTAPTTPTPPTPPPPLPSGFVGWSDAVVRRAVADVIPDTGLAALVAAWLTDTDRSAENAPPPLSEAELEALGRRLDRVARHLCGCNLFPEASQAHATGRRRLVVRLRGC